MILVRSRKKGFIGLLVGTTAIPQPPKLSTPGTPKIELLWLGVVLVDESWEMAPLADLVPVLPEDEEKE